MAKLKATPKNFVEALAVLNGRESMRLGNNTYLENLVGLQFIGVRLHNTYIVRFHYNRQITLHSGGYQTATTKERINQFIAGSIFQKAWQWYYDYPLVHFEGRGINTEHVRVPFVEGMNIAQEVL